jgi:hypothetical protein
MSEGPIVNDLIDNKVRELSIKSDEEIMKLFIVNLQDNSPRRFVGRFSELVSNLTTGYALELIMKERSIDRRF